MKVTLFQLLVLQYQTFDTFAAPMISIGQVLRKGTDSLSTADDFARASQGNDGNILGIPPQKIQQTTADAKPIDPMRIARNRLEDYDMVTLETIGVKAEPITIKQFLRSASELHLINQKFLSSHLPLPNLQIAADADFKLVQDLSKYAQVSFPELSFRGTLDPQINAINEMLYTYRRISDRISARYRIENNIPDTVYRAVRAWSFKVNPNGLPSVLDSLPIYKGTIIRQSKLDSRSIEALDEAFKTGTPLEMDKFVRNNYPEATVTVLAAAPGGNDLYHHGVTGIKGNGPVAYYRLVIQSKSGRYITPVSMANEQEVIIVGGQTKFKVLGKADPGRENIGYYFLDELP